MISVPNLDEIDQVIIRQLLMNSRISYAKLGKMHNLSRAAIQKRVELLINNGIIEEFTIRVNTTKLGKLTSGFFEVEVEPRYIEEVGNKLAEEDCVISIYQMTGPSSLHMHALLKDEDQLEEFLYKSIYPLTGVIRVQTHTVIKRFKQGTGLEI
ncbi:MAG: Lrp/AsnC family transcriptional regulator [Bacillota bacterium]